MRVLLLHNRYRQTGGEERAVRDLEALLRRRGHEVSVLERSSDGTGPMRAAAGLLRGGLDPGEVESAVRRTRADVVHAHNLHPLFGWRALAAARRAGARTVLHLHNFRLFCSIAICYRDGAPCYRCHEGWTAPGAALRCRGSAAESAIYAAGLSSQWRRTVESADALLAVSHATAGRLRALGVQREVVALHNFVTAPAASAASASTAPIAGAELSRAYALIAGRLVEEKGFDTAIAAARAAGMPLVVAGSGPDEERLRQLSAADARFVGHVSEAALAELRAGALAVLAPSRWEEPCPYSVLDALAAGVPVIGSDRGGLPELLEGQAVLPARDVRAWAAALRDLASSPTEFAERSIRARTAARERFGEEAYYARLIELYGDRPYVG